MTTLYEPPEPGQAPTAFGFNPTDNNFFAIGLNNGQIILKALRQKKGWERPGHPGTPITDLGFVKATKEKGTIITAGRDGSVKIWNFEIPSSDKGSDFVLNCKTTFHSNPLPIRIHFPPIQNQSKSPSTNISEEKFKFLIEQSSQLEIRSLDGNRHYSWTPEDTTIAGVAYDCSGSHLYVLLANKILYISSNKLEPVTKVMLDNVYTAIASNPKEQNLVTMGDNTGQVVVIRLKNLS